jgi:hypothetical protein
LGGQRRRVNRPITDPYQPAQRTPDHIVQQRRLAVLRVRGIACTDMQESTDRIEKALARIEAAARARAYAGERLAERHAVLRSRMEEAIAAIDLLINQEAGDTEVESE